MKTNAKFITSINFFKTKPFQFFAVVSALTFNLSYAAFAAEPTTRFDKTKDILIAQFDNKPDGDDIHSQAALGSLLAHSDFSGVNYFAVAGAYGKQSGKYINSNSLFTMAFGAQNVKWTDANSDRANSIIRIRDKAKQVLLAGGRVWVQEAGQSDLTADWIAALINSGITAAKIKTNVIIVQHSDWNENNTTSTDLNYVKMMANYVAIDDGNNSSGSGVNRGPNTPDYNLASTTYMIEVKSASNKNTKSKAYWTEADRIIKASGFKASYSPIPKGGVDFSDCVENFYIFNLDNKANTVRMFWDRYVVNSVSTMSSVSQRIAYNDVKTNIKVFPNPVSTMLTIETDTASAKEIMIFNNFGQMVYKTETSKSIAHVDVQSLQLKGVIVVKVKEDSNVTTHKILVE